MHLQVCPLSKLDDVAKAIRPNRVVSLVRLESPVGTPEGVEAHHHLHLPFHDIAEPRPGHVAPGEEHVTQLLAFARGWDRAAPMLIHCYAGISRSTAAAFTIACALAPHAEERAIAEELRGASPSATPNPRLIAIADAMLGRGGRMVSAIARIGRGADAYEGRPFRLDIAVA